MAQQPTPYLGSKISLISKSEIRYEGILYTVDQKEATIALAKVKSFGTEDRPTEHPVAPRDDVYQYIIFKAGDIKDLMVCETPKPVPQLCPGLPYDPAIVSVSQPSVPGPAQSLVSGLAAGVSGSAFSQTVKPVMGSGSSTRSGTPGHRSVSPTVDAGTQVGPSHNRAPGSGRHAASASRNQQQQQQQKKPYASQQVQTRTAAAAPQRAHAGQERGTSRQQGTQSYRNAVVGNQRGRFDAGNRGAYEYRRVYEQRSPVGQYYNRGQRMGTSRGAPLQRRQQTEPQPLKFDSDYDFEKANEQFQETLQDLKDDLSKVKLSDDEKQTEEKKEDSGAEVNAEEAESGTQGEEKNAPFYDATSSFFDRISCEALERQEGRTGRPNWRKERETNMETFGQAALRSYQYRRGNRGMMYNQRGRGYYYNGMRQASGYRGGARGGYNNYGYGGRGGYYYYQRY